MNERKESEMRLKSISHEAIPEALAKARQYRHLNEPVEAESICMDILAIEPNNQEAILLLLLAGTDQFATEGAEAFDRARKALTLVEGEYERAYYAGIICERQAKAALRRRGRRAGAVAYEWFQRAMGHYEQALDRHPPGDEDATLRWNTCVRLIERNRHCAPDPNEHFELGLE